MKMKIISLAMVFLVLTFTPIVLAEKNQIFFSVTLNYDFGIISQKDIKLIESIGEIDKRSDIGDYKLKIYSFSNKLLYETNFDFDLEIFNSPPREWFDDEGNQIYIPDEGKIESTTIEKTIKVLFAPYFSNAKSIEIYDRDNNLKLEVDVSKYAKKSSGIEDNLSYFIIGIILLILIGIIFSKRKNLFGRIKRSKSHKKK